MTKYDEARYQLQWHLDNGRGPFDLVFAALATAEAAEAKLAEAERVISIWNPDLSELRAEAEREVARERDAANRAIEARVAATNRVEALEKALREVRMHLGSTPFHYDLDSARKAINAALTTTDSTTDPTAP